MPNIDRPRGLTPIRHMNGSPWNGAMEVYYHSTGNAVAIYKGAIVQSDVGLASPSSDPLSIYQCVVMSTDNDADILGVAWAFGNTPQLMTNVTDLNAANYCAASAGRYIGVITDPSVVYLVQDDGTTLTAAQIGLNADINNNTSGSTTTGRSSGELGQDSLTAATAQLRILRVHNRPDNELAAWCDFEVVFNENIFKDADYLTT